MKKYYKDILNDYVNEVSGSYDFVDFRGQHALSYNYDLEYLSIYKIEVLDQNKNFYYINDMPHERKDNSPYQDYAITEVFFQSMDEIVEYSSLGKNFFDNSSDTQFKKIRKYFE